MDRRDIEIHLGGDHDYAAVLRHADTDAGRARAEVTLRAISEARPPHEPLRSHGVTWLGAVTPGSDAIRGRRVARAVRGFPRHEGAHAMVGDEQPTLDNEVWLRQVRPGESAALVAAYRDAVALAAYVRAVLDGVGVRPMDVVVVPSLTDTGRPVARLVVTPIGKRRLGSLRPSDGTGPYPLTA